MYSFLLHFFWGHIYSFFLTTNTHAHTFTLTHEFLGERKIRFQFLFTSLFCNLFIVFSLFLWGNWFQVQFVCRVLNAEKKISLSFSVWFKKKSSPFWGERCKVNLCFRSNWIYITSIFIVTLHFKFKILYLTYLIGIEPKREDRLDMQKAFDTVGLPGIIYKFV